MVIPDWLAALFEKLGLKTSPIDKLRRQIAGLEDERREIKEQIKHNIRQLTGKKCEYQALYPKFEAAQEPEKGLLAIELRSLKDEITSGAAELTSLIQSKVKVLDTLIHKNSLVLFGMEHGVKVADIEATTVKVEVMAGALQAEVDALEDLNSTSVTSPSAVDSAPVADIYTDLTPKQPEPKYEDLKPINTAAPVNTNTEYKA